MRVHVLLFNARTENEGIHTITIGGRNYVLMFEDEDDATRYAMLLEAQDFGSPTVEALEDDEIKEFCAEASYDWKLVPKNFRPSTPEERLLLAPPETNLENPDWDSTAPPERVERSSAPPRTEDSELDRIRQQLEKLL
ncbi:MAG: DUF3110 domain-containing protein [Hormoscilla sp. GM7CHS1pb]|nr:DUF3110 domain-containing protein [Hormoscilla sp. GM7CHS1pb]